MKTISEKLTVLKLYPELDKSSVRYLLRNGRRVPTSETDLVQVAQTLLDLGLVELKRRQYLKCVNQADDDFLDADDPDCEGRIPLDEGPPYKCPDCGRSLEYPGIDKEIFAELELNLRPEGIRAYLGKAVAALSTIARVEPVDQPALRVEFADGRALILALLDYTGRRWRAGGADERIIHAYVLASTIIKLSQEERFTWNWPISWPARRPGWAKCWLKRPGPKARPLSAMRMQMACL